MCSTGQKDIREKVAELKVSVTRLGVYMAAFVVGLWQLANIKDG
jgi:hypothetical protein